MHVNIFRHNLNVAPKTGVASPYRRRKKRGTNSLFLPKRSRRPTKSCGKTIQIYSFISRHGLNVNVAPKTGVAKTYPCHTTFQTGVAARHTSHPTSGSPERENPWRHTIMFYFKSLKLELKNEDVMCTTHANLQLDSNGTVYAGI